MTNETETKTTIAPKASVASGGALSALAPQNLDDAFRLAQALSMAGDMVPNHFQGKPEATMAAIIRGMEIGLAPMQALSNIAVINGRPSIWGDALPAIVQRAGHHIDVVIDGEGDSAVATATLTRGDTGKEIVRSFSMNDAKRAGLAGKKGPWQQYPRRMLSHRARGWAVRDGAADALMGLQIAEEVSDYRPIKDVTPEPIDTGRTNLAQRLSNADGGDASGNDETPPSDAPDGSGEGSKAEAMHEFDPDVVDPFSDAYTEGVKAHQAGMGTKFNPHEIGTPDWNNWLGGHEFQNNHKRDEPNDGGDAE